MVSQKCILVVASLLIVQIVIGLIAYRSTSVYRGLAGFLDEGNQTRIVRNHADGEVNHTRVAICLGLTTKGTPNSSVIGSMPFFKSLLPSFCRTSSDGYDYTFYIAYDHDDKMMTNASFSAEFVKTFHTTSPFSLRLLVCNYTGQPARSQNDAVIEAYLSGAEYFYRVNDDTIMESGGWTEKLIGALDRMAPPRVGVVGPHHSGGNLNILTYEFVHRTHVDIFGFHYPRVFTDWYADRWITLVYRPDHSDKVHSVRLVHTLENGVRHAGHTNPDKRNRNLQENKRVLARYLRVVGRKGRLPEPDPRRVIVMSLFSNSADQLWGAVRNAQLAPVIFPGWTLQFYTSDKVHQQIQNRILVLLRRLKAQVVVVPKSGDSAKVSIRDDPNVDVFLLRKATGRLQEHDSHLVRDWLAMGDTTNGTVKTKTKQKKGGQCWEYHATPLFSLIDDQLGVKATHLRGNGTFHYVGRILSDFVTGSSTNISVVNCRDIVRCVSKVKLASSDYQLTQEFDSHETPLKHSRPVGVGSNQPIMCGSGGVH